MERQWEPTTRGGHHVRNIEKIETPSPSFSWKGEVCLANSKGPSDDPRDWQVECWGIDGEYHYKAKSDLDLIEVQDGE